MEAWPWIPSWRRWCFGLPGFVPAESGVWARHVDLLPTMFEAAELGRVVVRERPGMGLGYYYLSQVLLEQGRPTEALAAWQSALAHDPRL